MDSYQSHESVIMQYSANRDVAKSAVLDSIEWLTGYGDLRCIFAICSLSLDLDSEIREKAWDAIEHYLSIVPSFALPQIEIQMRNKLVIAYGVKIEETKIPVKALGLLSFCFDGYVREKALRQLAGRYYEDELPFIILRLNDWVEKIHDIADGAIQERLHLAYGEFWIQHAALFYKLKDARRYEFHDLREAIEKRFQHSLHVKRALHRLSSPDDHYFRRYIYVQCLEGATTEHDLEKIVEEGLANEDVVIKLRAANAAFEKLPANKIGNLIPTLLKASFAPIRKESLRWIATNRWNDWHAVLFASLFDRNSAVREFARYCLPDIDHKSVYLGNLTEKKFSIEVSLFSLLELKTVVSLELVRPFLSEENTRVRAAAYALSFSLADRETARGLVLNAFHDGSARCEKVALGFLSRRGDVFNVEDFWDLYSTHGAIKRRRAILNAIASIDKWDSLPLLLLACAPEDSESQQFSEKAIAKWFLGYGHTFFTRPTALQLDRLNAAYIQVQGSLSALNRQRLDLVLGSLNPEPPNANSGGF